MARKQSVQRFFLGLFFSFLFLVLSLFLSLQRGSNGGLFHCRENYTFPRGSNIFKGGGGVQLFPEGVQMLISIKIHITCDLQGGGGVRTPISPLYPNMISMRERGNGGGNTGWMTSGRTQSCLYIGLK